MRKYLLITVVFTLVFSSIGIAITLLPTTIEEAFGKGVVKRGAIGGDVWELQGRLKHLGFYKGKIDGKFGWGTYWAVRNFQHEFGIKVDGTVGSETKLKLWKATKNWRPSANAGTTTGSGYKAHGHTNNDIKLMANAVYGESRGEPYVGQVAVAAVILNRVQSASFPNTPAGVIFEPRAFTAVADGQIWLTPNKTAKKAVQDALNGWDPTGGAIYYFNPHTATSGWIWSRPQIKKIGKHIFCR